MVNLLTEAARLLISNNHSFEYDFTSMINRINMV